MNMILWIKLYVTPSLFLFNLLSMFINSIHLMWILIEINNLNFITMMTMMNISNKKKINSIFSYFIIQSISSLFLMLSFIDYLNYFYENIYIFELSILLKMGIFPFHSWVIPIIMKSSWKIIFMLSTIQKINPFMLTYLYNFSYNMIFTIIISIILLSFYMMKQTKMKKIFAYSSIIHSSWMLFMILLNKNLWIIYFINYYMILYCLILMFTKLNINNNNFFYSIKIINFKYKFFLFLLFLSLMGMPPFNMMWISMFSIYKLLNSMTINSLIIISFLLFSKLMMMVSYLYISYPLMFIKNMSFKNMFEYSNNLNNNFIIFILFTITISFTLISFNLWMYL